MAHWRRMFIMFVALLALWNGASSCGAADYLWWEGEKPIETNFPKTSWFAPSEFKSTAHLLSEGDWLSASGKRGKDELFARYRITVPRPGQYDLWTRKFWKHGPFRWRFDRAAWQTCGRDVGLADNTFLKKHLGANWVNLGKVSLTQGIHTFELRLLAGEGESATACFDAFLLTRQPFMPRGKLKPDEKSGRADEGFFAWEPTVDPFRDTALLDLRYLNESLAGESGFVRQRGGDFVLGNGHPVKFWAVNVGANNVRQDKGTIDYMARKLAKLGVNMVRFHSPIFSRQGDPARVDADMLDRLHYLVAALRKEGIYTTLSFYFPLWFSIRDNYGIGGYETLGNKKPFALLYFNKRMQAIHRSWAKALLTTKNPYTGVPLGRDPAVAIVEIVNEDSYFFWTFTRKNVPEVHWKELETLFGRWAARRYGSLAKAFTAWGSARHPRDNAAAGVAGVFEAWKMTGGGLKNASADQRRRIGDQVRFLAESQRNFYRETVEFYKRDCRLGGLVSCSNWHVSDPDMLDALERWTYTAGDVIDRHGYFSGPHKGDGASHSVRVGHTFGSRSALQSPDRLPLQVNQVVGYPHIISEIGWPNPNRYRSDMTMLTSAYGALQGLDGFYVFAVGSNLLADTTMNKFALSCPVIAGTFPAAALQYRRGDIREAPAVFHQELRLEDLYAMKGASGAAAQALDALRQADVPAGKAGRRESGAFDPLSFYVGRVERTFATKSRVVIDPKLKQLINRDKGTVGSVTGELSLNFREGLMTINTPRSQAAVGFLAKAGRITLGDVAIESGNEYAHVWVIALDDKPIAESRRLLVQAMTEERPYGFRTQGNRITALGGWPFGVKRIEAKVTLRLRGAGRPKAVALDENGYPRQGAVPITGSSGEGYTVRLSPDAVYHVISR